MSIYKELEARRKEFCRPLPRDADLDDLFFCELGTLWCTEAHGDYEEAWYEIESSKKPEKISFLYREDLHPAIIMIVSLIWFVLCAGLFIGCILLWEYANRALLG